MRSANTNKSCEARITTAIVTTVSFRYCRSMPPGRRRPDRSRGNSIAAPRSSRTHAEFALAGDAQFLGEAGEFDQQLAGVARIDDLLDPVRFGRAEGRAKLLLPLFDCGDLGVVVDLYIHL